jgi:glycosyltransferase involved in cell wall biosynthesis
MASLGLFLVRNGLRFDVFHVHQYGYHAAVATLFAGLVGRPVILKLTSTGPEGIARRLEGLNLGSKVLARIHRRVDICVATTSAARDEAIEFGIPGNRVVVIPNGVDTGVFCPVSAVTKSLIRGSMGLGDGPVALFCGRLSPEKNVDGLLRAWREVSAAVPDSRLVILGDGPDMARIQSIVDSGEGGGGVMLLGAQKEVLPWYQAADLFVLSSHHEGLSNSLLEAMSCGLPVVSTRVSGSTDILNAVEVGKLVDIGDMKALQKAILELIVDPARRATLSARARDYAVANFSIATVVAATEAIYRRVLHPVKV